MVQVADTDQGWFAESIPIWTQVGDKRVSFAFGLDGDRRQESYWLRVVKYSGHPYGLFNRCRVRRTDSCYVSGHD